MLIKYNSYVPARAAGRANERMKQGHKLFKLRVKKSCFCVSICGGGERLKFGDVVTAVASLVVSYILLEAVLLAVFVQVNSSWGADVALILSVLVASLTVGYVFAAKIREESRRGAIGRIVVLFTLVLAFYTMASFANPYTGTAMNEGLESMFSTGGWTTMDWVSYSAFLMEMMVALYVVLALVFSFVGLYVGSMLRKPAKSQK
jgi:hypothetical protein